MIRKLQDDLRCLGIAFFENIELNMNACFGSIGLDCKRPFGNSLVESDILDIIGWEEDENYEDENGNDLDDGQKYARDLYYEELLPYVVQIGAKHFGVQFEEDDYGRREVVEK